MLETRAMVVSKDGRHALVQADQANGCGQCNGKGCGAGKLSRLFCSKPRQFQVNNPIDASVGDEVIVSVAEGAVMRGIGLVYLMPLALLVIGAMFGSFWAQQPGQSDGYAAVGGLIGLTAGFAFAKWISLRQAGIHFQPYIARQCREEL
ncbi:MAG: SoxR reducing system RseC family protein [Gallionella sp.]